MTSLHTAVLRKLSSISGVLSKMLSPIPRIGADIYCHDGPTYWIRAMNFDPNVVGTNKKSTHYITLNVESEEAAGVVMCVLNSSLFYLYLKSYSNCRDLAMREVTSFPIQQTDAKHTQTLQRISTELTQKYHKEKTLRGRTYPSGYVEYYEYYPDRMKSIIDAVDVVLAQMYDFTDEELDFIINYDIKYRMGLDAKT